MLHEQRVDRDPVLARQHVPQTELRLLRAPGPDDTEAVRDPVHVRVDRDRGDVVAEDEHAVRGLRADPGKARQLLERPGHGAAEPVEHLARAVADEPRLRVVEPGLADQRLDLRRSGRREAGRVGESREQAGARPIGRLVARALGEDGADHHLERVLGVVPQVRGPPLPPVVEGGEPVEHRDPVEIGRRGHERRLDVARAGDGGAVGSGGRGPTPGSERSGSSWRPCASRSSSPTR